jgi:hypothetical protein
VSDIYSDPVGNHLRAHDLRMREVRWQGATNIVIAIAICLGVVGVAWALAWVMVSNKPRFSTGVDATGKPYCESFDQRQCPIFQPGFTTTLPAEARR